MERLDIARELSDEEIREQIDDLILNHTEEKMLSLKERIDLRQELFYSVRKLDILQELLEDDTVTEIMVNGPDAVFVEREGKISRWNRTFTSREKLMDVIQQIAGRCNRVINESSPVVDARLPDGARVNAIVSPAALDGPVLTIRRFSERPITMDRLIAFGSISPEGAEFLKKLVEARYSIMIGGGTGCGKTTFLNALSEYIPRGERIITIEDNAELRLQGIENLVRLEAKNANTAGGTSVTIRDLIRTALRCRPDRIIVGEVRGGEALDLLTALNTGHEGSLSTFHANSCRDMLSRLETMTMMGMELPMEAIRRQIAAGVEILVHLGRSTEGKRKVEEITEICGYKDGDILLNPLYKRNREGVLQLLGKLKRTEKLKKPEG